MIDQMIFKFQSTHPTNRALFQSTMRYFGTRGGTVNTNVARTAFVYQGWIGSQKVQLTHAILDRQLVIARDQRYTIFFWYVPIEFSRKSITTGRVDAEHACTRWTQLPHTMPAKSMLALLARDGQSSRGDVGDGFGRRR